MKLKTIGQCKYCEFWIMSQNFNFHGYCNRLKFLKDIGKSDYLILGQFSSNQTIPAKLLLSQTFGCWHWMER